MKWVSMQSYKASFDGGINGFGAPGDLQLF
jgi:hypothetical protein